MTVIGGKTVFISNGLADELNTDPVGLSTWPSQPLENRLIFKGPPPIPDYMRATMQ